LLPRVIAGSSVGALVAACFAGHKYSDLWKCFNEEYKMMTGPTMVQKFSSLFEAIELFREKRPLLCTQTLKNLARRFTGDMTFIEIWEKNKWNLNITVTDSGR
jgi:predicted acylesterase/phospholipase RssA